jgi:hypothetical protein
MAGYSGTPLARKLGLNEGSHIVTIGAPKDYLRVVTPVPAGVNIGTKVSASTDIVHVFSTQRAELERILVDCRSKLKPNAMVWVSWPKKSAKVPTDITEDTIRDVALPLGFVDVKVCAVTDIWSGLKLVVRKELR